MAAAGLDTSKRPLINQAGSCVAAVIGGIAYWVIGFPLAFGKDGNGFMGTGYWAGHEMPDTLLGHWFFDFVHAATASTLVSGALAERCNFYAYLLYSFVITGFIYPIVSHWVWSPHGWLHSTPYTDYAGGGVVHLTGGVAAFVGAAVIGPRIGRFHRRTGKALDIKGHSVPLAALGGFILLFGFLAFSGGFHGHISHEGDGVVIAKSIVNALFGACGGGVGAMVIHRAGTFGRTHSWSFLLSLNGALCGMVSVFSGNKGYHQWAAMLVGLIGGFVFLLFRFLLRKILKVDDPLDAVPVHFGGGFWGLIAVALFHTDSGIVFDPSHESLMVLAWNMIGAAAIIGWAGGLCVIMFTILKCFNLLRVPEDMEMRGLDLFKHGEPAYPISAWEECDPGPTSAYTIATNLNKILKNQNGDAPGRDLSGPKRKSTEKKLASRQISSASPASSSGISGSLDTADTRADVSNGPNGTSSAVELDESESKTTDDTYLNSTKSSIEQPDAAGTTDAPDMKKVTVVINGIRFE